MHIRSACLSCALVAFVVTSTSYAAQRTFVSVAGVDNLACSLAAPCRTFGAAVAATSSGGEVIVLDSGGYGPVSIDKSVSIIAPPGVYAGISVFPNPSGSSYGVEHSAIGPNDKVVLRGLTINGQGGDFGILVGGDGSLHIEDCVVSSVAVTGIHIVPQGGLRVCSSMAQLFAIVAQAWA